MSTSIPSNPVKPINFYNTDFNFDLNKADKALKDGTSKLRLVSEGIYVPSSSPVTSLNLPGSGMDIPQATKPIV